MSEIVIIGDDFDDQPFDESARFEPAYRASLDVDTDRLETEFLVSHAVALRGLVSASEFRAGQYVWVPLCSERRLCLA